MSTATLVPRNARTIRSDDGLYVLCPCGKKCHGRFFSNVRSQLDGDAWMAFRRHWSRAHGPYPYFDRRLRE